MKKVALVTGAAVGIGQAIVLELAKAGYKVYANARSEAKIQETLRLAKDYDVEPAIFDTTKEEEIKNVISKIEHLDALVNNACVSIEGKFRDMGQEEWDLTLNTNVKGYFFVTKYALEKMERGAAIVNISSGAAKTGGDFVSMPYSTSKGAINTMTVCFARDLTKEGIRVNAVSPGFVDTNMLIRNEKLTTEYYDSIIPLGFLGKPEDISGVVKFLLSDEARYTTGQIIEVNGGDIMG